MFLKAFGSMYESTPYEMSLGPLKLAIGLAQR